MDRLLLLLLLYTGIFSGCLESNIRHVSMKRASELKIESSVEVEVKVEVEVEVVLPYWSGVYPYRNLCIAFSSYLINIWI
jgi:hypothetical protein